MYGLFEDEMNSYDFNEARGINELFPKGQERERHNSFNHSFTPKEVLPIKQSPHKEPSCRKMKWSANEDIMLKKAVEIHGTKNWTAVASLVLGRNPKQCRERWTTQIDPTLRKSNWTVQEDNQLLLLQRRFGNYWTKISKFLPGRSSISCKNRYNWLSSHKVTIPNSRHDYIRSQPNRNFLPMPLLPHSESSFNGSMDTSNLSSNSDFSFESGNSDFSFESENDDLWDITSDEPLIDDDDRLYSWT